MKKPISIIAWTAALGLTAAVAPATESPTAHAWGADAPHDPEHSTHLWIADNAIEIMARNTDGTVKANEVGYLNDPQYRNQFEQGLYDADYLDPFNNGGYTFGGWKSHFYDPDTKENYYGETSPTALTEGSKYFKYAGEYFQKGNYDKAFYFLGVAAHYFTDSTQPMHSSNFTALDSPTGFHSDYEEYAQTIHDRALVTDANGHYNSAITTPESWVHAAAVNSKAKFATIGNSTVYSYYNAGNTAAWQQAVTPGTLSSLDAAQRQTAGFLHLWFKTYVGDTPVKTPKDNGVLLDSKGDTLQAGKPYYLVPSSYPKRGLTFEVYNNWDYVLQSAAQADAYVHGTPVVLHKEGDVNDPNIYHGSDASISMTASNWSSYNYFTTYKKNSYYPYQDSRGVPVYMDVQDHRDVYRLTRTAAGSSSLNLNTGKYLNSISPLQQELYLGWLAISTKNWSYLTTNHQSSEAIWQFVPVQ
ncbi:zinc dependent phospholipase C family protein [Tumebacillus sp. DT12]|uniref:Phospholipase C n=1 Tax=Tumebacillus lacus TaxID=2995335 RepID=A0ABT3X3R6_9BACL|nr:zinc dependent phospholipase C family protein [Tumebacillus lacus]MCX7571532.1 zinc dependent phospholipase C family protein [Tumebacillus lacus]